MLAVAAYVKETGDRSVLSETVPYDNQTGSETSLDEHLHRCVAYTLDRLGPHGLPLIGRADWNDCLNLNAFSENPGESFQTTTHKDGKIAESLFIAGLFILAVKELHELIDSLPQDEKRRQLSPQQDEYIRAAAQMEAAVWRHGWDGEWFLRAYDDFWASSGVSRQPRGTDIH